MKISLIFLFVLSLSTIQAQDYTKTSKKSQNTIKRPEIFKKSSKKIERPTVSSEAENTSKLSLKIVEAPLKKMERPTVSSKTKITTESSQKVVQVPLKKESKRTVISPSIKENKAQLKTPQVVKSAQNNLIKYSYTTNPNDLLKVTRYMISPEELNLQDEFTEDKVYIKVYYKEKSSITEDYHYFKPKKNEILFFYGKDEKKKISQMYFKFDDTLKTIYKKKDINKMIKIMDVLEYNVFSNKDFSIAEAYTALDNI
ncbi:hypothetical protein [Lacinutrix salivirga]